MIFQWIITLVLRLGIHGCIFIRSLMSDNPRGLKVNNSATVLQAAINGQGVALARSVMVYDDLRAGRLVRLYPEIKCPCTLAYYVVYREECRTLPKLSAFKDWLIQQA
jgi:LysR family glycine cleavage system transcriptional activator